MPDQPRTILFLHIPKTGGTTLNGIIQRQYPADRTYYLSGPRGEHLSGLLGMAAADQARLQLIHGHMGFGLHEQLASRSTYFTVLREPVARVISTYNFIRRTPAHTHYAAVTTGQLSLRDYILRKVSPVGGDNGQVRLLSGAAEAGGQILFGECTPELLDQAKANLREHFSVVGLLERFDETLIMLRRSFGWRMPVYLRANANPNRDGAAATDDETRALIAQQNALDLALYQHARAMFEQELRRQPASFWLELRCFRMLNAAYGRMQHTRIRSLKNRLHVWSRSKSSL